MIPLRHSAPGTLGLPFIRKPSLWLFAALSLFAQIVLGAAPPNTKEILYHQRNGPFVEFSLAEKPLAVSLQGLVAANGRWVSLVSRKNPVSNLSRLRIPARWRQAELRVVASYGSKDAARDEISHHHDPATRAVTFLTTAGARLFSVEAEKSGQHGWERVCTVAAPEAPTSVRVVLPASLPEGARIRVVAVSGRRKTFPRLSTPLPSLLRGGPADFGATPEALSGQPLFSAAMAGSVSDTGAKSALPSVEESDVWRVHGDKIYFFNRLRGLQVIDAADSANPRLSGQLPLAGVGEEMYILAPPDGDATGAILLTSLPWSPTQAAGTKINRISFEGDVPAFETSIDLPGDYVESRLIGGLLHVITKSSLWDDAKQGRVGETFLITIDLLQGNTLVKMPIRTLPFEASVVGSTGKYLWVAGASPTNGSMGGHRLAAFPINFLDGSIGAVLETEVGGRIQDKFKVGDTSQGLAVVVQSWSTDWVQKTSVETYSEGVGLLSLDASLPVVTGESLFASRFDGDRLYAVTFQQVDPLWIIDLSDPAKPEIKGHLEVPGWSSFIHPLGDVLLAVGRDGGRVQVSMFDVSDPAMPDLAGRVDIGEGWSWSEAESNEKAVKILPEAGLILVPVVESFGNTRSSRVSLVEFDAAARTLAKRGTISHEFVPRRAALMRENVIASLSNRELLLVDASDRDQPSVTGKLGLAYGVDRIVLHGGTALLFENGEAGWRGSERKATLRIADSADTQKITGEIELPCEEVAAAAVFGDRLVLVERPVAAAPFLWWRFAGDIGGVADESRFSVWSLADPKRPSLVGRMPLPHPAVGDVDLLPVDGGRVAIVSRDSGFNFYVRPLPVARPVISDAPLLSQASVARIAPPYLGWGEQSLRLAIAEIDGLVPGLVGTWDLAGESYTGISEVFSAGELLVFSFALREEVPDASADGYWSSWTTRHWLQILDLADVSSPMPWAPVQLPGELIGVSWLQRPGGVIFARSDDRIAALGFDGENASIVAELPASSSFCLQGSSAYLAVDTGVAEWMFSDRTKKWHRQSGWEFDPAGSIYQLYAVDGALLAGGFNQAWVLGEDGSIASTALPPGADLSAAAGDGNAWFAPAGEHGAVRLR